MLGFKELLPQVALSGSKCTEESIAISSDLVIMLYFTDSSFSQDCHEAQECLRRTAKRSRQSCVLLVIVSLH